MFTVEGERKIKRKEGKRREGDGSKKRLWKEGRSTRRRRKRKQKNQRVTIYTKE